MASTNDGSARTVDYRERLSPSLWVLVAAAVCGPMAALVVAPVDTTLALVLGALVAVALVVSLILASPIVEVKDGMLRAGRARIEVEYTGEPVTTTGEDARTARGPGLSPRSWHIIRGGIDPVVVIPITDEDDPAPSWVISSRTPDRLVSALRHAKKEASAR